MLMPCKAKITTRLLIGNSAFALSLLVSGLIEWKQVVSFSLAVDECNSNTCVLSCCSVEVVCLLITSLLDFVVRFSFPRGAGRFARAARVVGQTTAVFEVHPIHPHKVKEKEQNKQTHHTTLTRKAIHLQSFVFSPSLVENDGRKCKQQAPPTPWETRKGNETQWTWQRI